MWSEVCLLFDNMHCRWFWHSPADRYRLPTGPHKVFADENITTPVFHEGFLIVSGCVTKGTTSLRLDVSGDTCSVSRHWHSRTLDNKQGGIVLVDGRI